MIFLDANVFLRALTQPATPDVAAISQVARDLFVRVDHAEAEVTTSEAVIAEVAFVLASKNVYNLPAADAAARLATVLRLRGVKLRDKRIIFEALDLWATTPKLGFVDALTAAYARRPDIELATFDTEFDGLSGITRWQPPADSDTRDRNGA